MASTVASLQAVIGADISGLDSGLRQAEDKIGGFGSRLTGTMRSAGQSMLGLGASMTAATAPLALGFASGISAASSFESTITQISSRTGIVGEELQAISDYALQMGADTVFSGQQAADAFLQILTSGSSVEEAYSILPAVLDAAAAGGMDLGVTADVLTDIMASFGLEAENAADVVDSLAKASGSSSADIASLGQGFANVGGIARQFGLSVNDTASILALFSENGVKGAEAGTQLKSMLMNMTRDTPEVTAAWERLGTSFYDASGAARPLGDVIEDIKAGMEGMSVEEQNQIMKDLGGSYGILGLSALTGAMSMGEMQEKMAAAADAGEVAGAQMDTFGGALNSLKGSIETLQITALTPFMNNTLKPLIQDVTAIVNRVTDWAKENPRLTNAIVSAAAAVAVAGPLVMALGAALLFLSGPGLLAVGAIAGIAAASSLLGSVDVSAILAGLSGISVLGVSLGDVAAKVRDLASGALSLGQLAVTDFSAFKDTVSTGIRDAIDGITLEEGDTSISGLVESLRAKITSALDGISITKDDITGFPETVKTAITGALDSIEVDGDKLPTAQTIKTKIEDGWNSAQNIDLANVEAWANENLDSILGTVVAVAGIIFGGPVGMAIGGAKLIATAIENDFLGIGTFLEESGIGQAVTDAFNTLKTTVEDIFSAIFGGGQAAPKVVSGAEFFDPTSTAIEDGAHGLMDRIGAIEFDVPDWAQPLVAVFEGLKAVGDGIAGFFAAFEGTETEGITNAIGPVLEFVVTLAGMAAGLAGNVIGSVLQGIGDALPSVGEAISSVITAISRLLDGDIEGGAEAFGTAVTAIADAGRMLVGGIADGIISGIEGLFGVELPNVEETLNLWAWGFQQAWISAGAIIDDAKRGLERLSGEIRLELFKFIESLPEFAKDALGIDMSENIADLEAWLDTMRNADMIRDELINQAATGQINLGEFVNWGDQAGNMQASSLADYLMGDFDLINAQLGERGKLMIEQALRTAVLNADKDVVRVRNEVGAIEVVPEVTVLWDLAKEMGINTTMLEDQYNAMLEGIDLSYEASLPGEEVVQEYTSALQVALTEAFNGQKTATLDLGQLITYEGTFEGKEVFFQSVLGMMLTDAMRDNQLYASLGEQGAAELLAALESGIRNADKDMFNVYDEEANMTFAIPEVQILWDAAQQMGLDTSALQADFDALIADIGFEPATIDPEIEAGTTTLTNTPDVVMAIEDEISRQEYQSPIATETVAASVELLNWATMRQRIISMIESDTYTANIGVGVNATPEIGVGQVPVVPVGPGPRGGGIGNGTAPASVTVNVAGTVTTERDLVAAVQRGLEAGPV